MCQPDHGSRQMPDLTCAALETSAWKKYAVPPIFSIKLNRFAPSIFLNVDDQRAFLGEHQ